jgi:hypothetical protein
MWVQLTKKKWLKKMASMPENGMGYHIVDVTLRDGRIIKKTRVLNGEVLQVPGTYNFLEKDITDIKPSA